MAKRKGLPAAFAGLPVDGMEPLFQVYQVGQGNYARFLKYKSPMMTRVLAIFGTLGGLTGCGPALTRALFGWTDRRGQVVCDECRTLAGKHEDEWMATLDFG